jgi:hypothetical protein
MLMVARCYQTKKQARAAFDALRENGYDDDFTVLLPAASTTAKGEKGGSGVSGAVIAAMRAGGVLGEHVDFYASRLEEGLSVVVASPPFGSARAAEEILDEHDPLPISHLPPPKTYEPLSEQPHPLSSALGLPLLSKQATPVSDFWGLNVLTEGRSFLSRLMPELAPDFTLSRLFGMNTLSDNGTPLSSMANMSTRSSRLQNESSSFGMALTTSNGTPLSSWLNLPLLSKRDHFLYQ